MLTPEHPHYMQTSLCSESLKLSGVYEAMTDPRGRHITLQKPTEPADPESMHHGGSFKKYMEFKNQKLREQFRDEAVEGDTAAKQRLFSGISIHVNGFTIPTHQVCELGVFPSA